MSEQVVFGRRTGFPPAPAVETQDAGVGNLLDLFLSTDGRLRRSYYILARLGKNVVFGVVLIALNLLILTLNGGVSHPTDILNIVPLLLLSAWIDIALQIKRRHDLDQAWPLIWIGFIPVIGWAWVWIECAFLDGTPGWNRFGPSPKESPSAMAARVF